MTQRSKIATAEEMRKAIARPIGNSLHGGAGQGFEVWHSEVKDGSAEILVHDFTFVDEDDIEWRGSFKLTISDLDAYVEDEEIDW